MESFYQQGSEVVLLCKKLWRSKASSIICSVPWTSPRGEPEEMNWVSSYEKAGIYKYLFIIPEMLLSFSKVFKFLKNSFTVVILILFSQNILLSRNMFLKYFLYLTEELWQIQKDGSSGGSCK